MDDKELPPLPPVPEHLAKVGVVDVWHYAQEYARQAVTQERERCAAICDEWASSQIAGGVASMCARDIRGLADEPGCLHEAAAIARNAIAVIQKGPPTD